MTKQEEAFRRWWGSAYDPTATPAFKAGWEAALREQATQPLTLAEDEHLPTLEGVLEYLERQNDLAFLEYRRQSNMPYVDCRVKDVVVYTLYAWWQGIGEALQLAKVAAKPQPIAVHTIAAHP